MIPPSSSESESESESESFHLRAMVVKEGVGEVCSWGGRRGLGAWKLGRWMQGCKEGRGG